MTLHILYNNIKSQTGKQTNVQLLKWNDCITITVNRFQKFYLISKTDLKPV